MALPVLQNSDETDCPHTHEQLDIVRCYQYDDGRDEAQLSSAHSSLTGLMCTSAPLTSVGRVQRECAAWPELQSSETGRHDTYEQLSIIRWSPPAG